MGPSKRDFTTQKNSIRWGAMIVIVLGTRPEIIKMSPVIRECEKRELDFFILHTGQHYTREMDQAFFDDLELPQPKYNLDVGSGPHGFQTGKIMAGIEKILMKERPDTVLVQGDTNTVLAGALATVKLHIKLGHVESGLRSFDRNMPEEINRVVTDHIADYLFAPTRIAEQNLLNEGIDNSKIFVTGNTIVDAVFQNLEIASKKSDIISKMQLSPKEYFLVTLHRAENVDLKERLQSIIGGLEALKFRYDMPVIFPIHPRTEKRMMEFGISPNGIGLIKPIGYLDFLQLQAQSTLVLTDSGGLQEESCILGVPCVTLRDNTERPETLHVGSNILAGTDSERIINAARKMTALDTKWENPFGNGKSAEKIVDAIT
jgi:UDP-N-acetylglucosamine 2-epimerase (non-hydrolysing)